MTLDNYEIMMKHLDGIIGACEKYIKPIKNKECIENMVYKDVEKLVDVAKTLQSQMDIIFKNELYHIIGMGNLTMMQQYMFLEKIKELGSYRSYVKAIVNINLPKLPTIPTESEYVCKALGIDLAVELKANV